MPNKITLTKEEATRVLILLNRLPILTPLEHGIASKLLETTKENTNVRAT